MDKEQFELLKQDLCSRLSHGVKIRIGIPFLEESDYPIEVLSAIDLKTYTINNSPSILIENVKPFLRPMSSMTEEEGKEFGLLQTDFYVDGFLYPIAAVNMINWLNEHHFDYYGLIEKGLALEAPEGMYK